MKNFDQKLEAWQSTWKIRFRKRAKLLNHLRDRAKGDLVLAQRLYEADPSEETVQVLNGSMSSVKQLLVRVHEHLPAELAEEAVRLFRNLLTHAHTKAWRDDFVTFCESLLELEEGMQFYFEVQLAQGQLQYGSLRELLEGRKESDDAYRETQRKAHISQVQDAMRAAETLEDFHRACHPNVTMDKDRLDSLLTTALLESDFATIEALRLQSRWMPFGYENRFIDQMRSLCTTYDEAQHVFKLTGLESDLMRWIEVCGDDSRALVNVQVWIATIKKSQLRFLCALLVEEARLRLMIRQEVLRAQQQPT